MTDRPLRVLAEAALECGLEAGAFLLAGRDRVLEVATKSTPTDVVTDMDRASERMLVERILARFPTDGLLGEEGAERQGTSGVRWVIDPLDGTVNYLYGLPIWAVSVGVEHNGAAVAGAVVVPALGESFFAWRGGGAWRLRDGNASPISASQVDSLQSALIGTGFGYDSAVRTWQGQLAATLLPHVRDIRRAGAAAVDLCSVAAGSLDGYYEAGLQPWDVCAGGLIASEAGAVVTGLNGAAPGVRDVVAAGPRLHASLVSLLECHDQR